jgi:hypothetical protein
MRLIPRCDSIKGKNLTLRLVEVSDADFILSLRLDSAKKRYVSSTSSILEHQQAWIKKSLTKENEVFFIILDSSDVRIGCLRMYGADSKSYRWGSWLMIDGLNPLFAIEAIAILYSYGKVLGFPCAKFEVRHENTSVWNFHQNYTGARLTSLNSLDRVYEMDSVTIDAFLTKHEHLLTIPLDVRGMAKV